MIAPEPTPSIASAADIVAFWRDAGEKRWFEKNTAFDETIRDRFLATYRTAASGALDGWASSAEGSLALLILLDQFPRNMFRGSAEAFATDPKALRIADAAIAHGFDRAVTGDERQFLYLPFMHSERLADQERGLALYNTANLPQGLKYAEMHADIIRRFGRFPHRNAVLGRTTTAAEQAFLDAGGFAG